MNRKYYLFITLLVIYLVSCKVEKKIEYANPLKKIENTSPTSLERLSAKKIYFGHKSVGYNIIDGIKDILNQETIINMRIVETTSASDFVSPLFAHSSVGRNTYPVSKMEAFSGYLENGIGKKTDIAFLKLCYIDFNPLTNIEEVFRNYKSTMFELSQKYPEVLFVHFTVPLLVRESGIKTIIKKILGRPLWGYDDNIIRERYNEKLRKEYAGKEPLFDIAKIESTFPDGSREVYQKEGETYYALVPAYTDDGGHLNEKGRRIVAEQLLIELAKITIKSE